MFARCKVTFQTSHSRVNSRQRRLGVARGEASGKHGAGEAGSVRKEDDATTTQCVNTIARINDITNDKACITVWYFNYNLVLLGVNIRNQASVQ